MRLLVKTQNNSSPNKFKNSVLFQMKNPRTHLGLFQPEKMADTPTHVDVNMLRDCAKNYAFKTI